MGLVFLILVSVTFDFLNGMRDASNFVTAMISTHAMPARAALWLTALAEFAAPFIVGTRVAVSFSHDLVAPGRISLTILLAVLLSATAWNVLTLVLSLPSSSSHAVFGAIVGAVTAGAGFDAIQSGTVARILISLFLSPLAGLAVGFLVTRLVYTLASSSSPLVNRYFRQGQVVTGVALAFSYGANDAQKSMGLISLALLVTGVLPSFSIPTWVMTLSAAATALGIGLGGARLIRTLGSKFYRIRPVHGFTAQVSSAGIILLSSVFGAPVSTSQVVTTSILGAGSAERVNKVRWGTAAHIVRAWFLTIPICAGMGALFFYFLRLVQF
jgi:inorganic phosphate transporter, PiT family